MLKALRCIAIFLATVSVAACTTASLQELRQATPKGSPFQIALAREYLGFSESEAKQYDWGSSKYFADKGLQAAYGQDTTPEEAVKWGVEAAFLEELNKARAELIAILTPETITAKPDLSARAQFFYDCWVEQQDEGWQVEDITSCKQGFYKSLNELQGTPVVAEEEDAMDFASSYILFFDWAKAELKPDALTVIDTVATDLKAGSQDYEVVLNGHADRSGSTEYNLKLSQKRAEATKGALVERGIPAERIRYYAFGETDNRIPTKDGQREPANRRVEIFFNQ